LNRFAGIEAGGTKFVCAIGNNQGEISERIIFPTESPALTLQKVFEYIDTQDRLEKIDAIGVACFGPVELDKRSRHYGHITATPKPDWQYFDIVGQLKNRFNLPVGFDTDVNGAALGEHYWGAAKLIDHFMYITVGTGIGGGVMVNKKLVHGAPHPEMGHLLIPQDKLRDPFPGVCPYHNNCLEGLASGPAMMKRWNVKSALDLPPEHEAWNLEAYYLAVACMNYILTLAPEKIILGGGVMKQTHLFEKIHQQLPLLLNGYIPHENIITDKIHEYIIPAGLGENAGISGAIALAEDIYEQIYNK
jgi:fructokinase